MPINQLKALIDQVSSYHGRTIKSDVALFCEEELKTVLWRDTLIHIMSAKRGIKQSLLQELSKELEREVSTEIIIPQQDIQQAAITRKEIDKVNRLPLNAKFHLLKNNSLLNNIQLAFSDPSDYIEFDTNKFVWMKPEQIQDEISRAIRNYVVVNPLKTKSLYTRLWLSLSLDNTENLKKLLADAKLHQYTTRHKVGSFKEKTTPRITYIQWYPMLFGKNLVHTEYGLDATRAEKSKYDIDTSAKLFDDFYSLIRAHSHIQDSEQVWIDALTELNTDFAQAASIIKDKDKRQQLESLIQDIIDQLAPKKDSKVKKAKDQDLIYILENHHTIRNDNKLQAARKKIKERITAQQQIKNTVATQQNALHEDLAEQEIFARQYIASLQQHISNFNTKNRSARKLALTYQEKLYAKPFYDLHDHIIQLEDQTQLRKWMPYTLKIKMTIDLLLQRFYITTLYIYNQYQHNQAIPEEEWFDNILKTLHDCDIDEKDKEIYLSTPIHILQKIRQHTVNEEIFAHLMQNAKDHMKNSRANLIQK